MAESRYRYFAFLSYAHRDKTWGDWIHSALEHYRVPRQLVGRETRFGPVPASLRPIFRDRYDLSASHSLDERIGTALDQAAHLIVLCSPAAARSPHVNEEVRRFKAMGKGERIVALIVDGEPHDPERECFPRALLNAVDGAGSTTEARDAEPIAADARHDADGQDLAKLKVIGGLLGLDLDEIRRRDLAEQRRQKRIWQGVAAAMCVLALAASVSALFWQKEYKERTKLLDRTRSHLEQSLVQASELVQASADTNDEFGVPVHVVESFMKNANSFIVDADKMLAEVELGNVKVDVKRAKAHALLNFARTAGKVPKSVGKGGQAEELARAAKAILDELVKSEGEPLDSHHDLSEARMEIAGSLLQQPGRVDDAIAEYLEACRTKQWIIREMAPGGPNWFPWRRELAGCHVNTGQALLRRDSVAPAMAAFENAMVLLRELLAERPEDTGAANYAMNALRMLIDGHRQEGDIAAARATAAEGRAIGERASRDRPGAIKIRRGLALIQLEQGDVMVDLERYDEALASYEPASATYSEMVALDPKNVRLRNSLAWSLVTIGNARLHKGDLDGSWRWFESADKIYSALMEEQPENVRWRSNYGHVLDGFAEVHGARGQVQDALAVRERQLDIFEKSGLVANLAQARVELGKLHLAAGRPRDALGHFHGALATRRVELAKDAADTGKKAAVAAAIERLAEAQRDMGDFQLAALTLSESHAIRKELHVSKPRIEAHRAALGESELRLGLLAELRREGTEAQALLASARDHLDEANREVRRPSWARLRDEAVTAMARLERLVATPAP